MAPFPAEQPDTSPTGSGARLLPWLLAFAAYSALTLAMTWPLATRLTSAMTHDRGDPALATWILWWNAHVLPLTSRWWNAPIYWPVPGAFTFSEHLIGISLVTTPLQWLGASPLLAYNAAFLMSFVFAALATHGLVFAIAKRHDAAFIGGSILAFNPYRIAQVPHLQVLWVFGMPLALMALHFYLERGRRAWLVLFAVAWFTLASSNGYYLLFFPVLLACWILWFAARHRLGDVRAIIIAWIAGSLPLVPFLWKYRQVHSAFHMVRGIGEIEAFSADLTAIIAASPELILWHGLSRWTRPEGQLFPGLLALILVGAGLVAAWRARPDRRDGRNLWPRTRVVFAALAIAIIAVAISPLLIGPWRIAIGNTILLSVSAADKPLSIAWPFVAAAIVTGPTFVGLWEEAPGFAFYTLGAALMFILSLGPRVWFNGARVMFTAPYAWLLALPGFSEVRAPARFGMLFVLCVAVAAALGFDRLSSPLRLRVRHVLAAIAVAIIMVESWPHMILVDPPPPIVALRSADGGTPVAELPLGDPSRDIAAIYRSMDHGHPLVNGWGGYDAPGYVLTARALAGGDGGVLTELARRSPLTIAIDHRVDFDRWSSLVTGLGAVQIADDGEHRLYRLEAAIPDAVLDGAPLPIQSVVANAGNETIGRLFDDDWFTAWSSQAPQTGREQLLIDLGRERNVAGLQLAIGGFDGDYPRRLTIECSGEPERWEPCWNGSTGALALRAILDSPLRGQMAIPIHRSSVRRLRLRQTGTDTINAWSIVHLTVLGS